MTENLPARRWSSFGAAAGAVVMLVAVTATGCSVRLDDGKLPATVSRYRGSNGLLVTPSALTPHESLDQTVFRFAAAHTLGLDLPPLPDAARMKVMLAALPAQDRVLRTLLWSTVTGNPAAAAPELKDLASACAGHDAGDMTPRDCAPLVDNVAEVARAAHRPDLLEPLRAHLATPTCPAGEPKDPEAALAVLACGASPTAAQVENILSSPGVTEQVTGDPVLLWQVAALAQGSGHGRNTARRLVRDAIAQPRQEGFYLSTAAPIGTILTTWALLSSASDGAPTYKDAALARVLRDADVDGRADQMLFRDASLRLLGSDLLGTPEKITLRDADGPYNPFVALAARQLGVQGRVEFDVPRSAYAKDPLTLASAVTTIFLTGGTLPHVTDAQAGDLLQTAAQERLPHGARLLARTALEILRRDTSRLDEQVWDWGNCGGASWMLSASDGDQQCDLRATATAHLRTQVGMMLR